MESVPELDATEQRILGSLLEKQVTVPASYPLSLNALRQACNQASSRDPVTDLGEVILLEALKSLKARGLVRFVWAGQGSRVLKYHQLLDEVLSLQPDERAVVAVLLLRGPQTAGELRTRTDRLHAFADKDAVGGALGRLAALPSPVVRELEPRRGRHDSRWAHLLGPLPEAGPTPAASGVDREVVLAQGAAVRDAAVRAAWDAAAADYADTHADALTWKPFDVWLLERVAGLAGADPVLDLGCGPGHTAAFLADAGASVSGLDLSPAMIARAGADFPDLEFAVGNLASLVRPRSAAAWGAVVAIGSLLHLAPSELAPAVAEMARVLRPDGWVLLSVAIGDRVERLTDLLGHAVDVAVVEHDAAAVLAAVSAAGLVDVEWYRRNCLPRESGGELLYVLARKP